MSENKAKNIQISILLFSIMIIIGYVGNLRGVLVPSIKQDLGITYADVGLMIFITSLGYFSATLIGGFVGDRIGQKKILAFGFAVVALGLVGIFFTRNFFFLLTTMFILNTGIGCFDIGLNSLATKVFVTNTAVMMSLMHVFYGMGSAASPKMVGWMRSKNISWNSIYLYAIIIVAAVFVFFVLSPIKLESNKTHSKVAVSTILKDKRIWYFIAVLGFCEAFEVGFGTWLTNFLQVERGFKESSSTQYMFYFFIIYTIGRLFGGYIAEKLGYIKTVLTFVSVAVLLMVCGLTVGSGWPILFSLTGFFISIMFPTMVTIISKEFKQGISSVLGIVMTSAGLMCVGINWLIGKINDNLGVLTGFAMVPVCGTIAITLLFVLKGHLISVKTQHQDLPAGVCAE